MDDVNDVDVVIIGAGAAGLVAARELRAAGIRIAILEARGRVGGRIFTYRDRRVPVPIELGAEFLHGHTPETSAIIAEANLTPYDVIGEHWRANEGKLKQGGGSGKRVDRVMEKLDPHRTPDQSFLDYLHSYAGKPKRARDRQLACAFVQGFHAADVSRISAQALAEMELPQEERTGRVLEGYDRVAAWLAREVYDAVILNTVVERIVWEPGRVQIQTRSGDGEIEMRTSYTAKAAIITVPLSILQVTSPEQGGIEFSPDVPTMRDAVSRLAMGSALRVVFAFNEPFWEHRRQKHAHGDTLEQLSFLYGRGTDVPVWWTLFPLRLPIMVGWVGGPPAAELAQQDDATIQQRALASLAHHLGTAVRRLESQVNGGWIHNWDRDPFTRGAYSYPLVGGKHAGVQLAQPVEETLFFAGEAAAGNGQNGTVEGALATGRLAAQNVLGIFS
jgi:monoamine oxidase